MSSRPFQHRVHPSACAAPGVLCRRDLLAAAGSLLLAKRTVAAERSRKVILLEHRWVFQPAATESPEVFVTRFGVVHLGRPERLPVISDELGNLAYVSQCDSEPELVMQDSDVLFLTGPAEGTLALRPALVRSPEANSPVVIDLSCGEVHTTGSLAAVVISDLIRAYVQQGVAFDLEDTREAMPAHSRSRFGVSVARGPERAQAAALNALRQQHPAVDDWIPQGQLVLLTFDSPRGCLRQAKQAFNAVRAKLPASAVAVYGVGFDAHLPPNTARAGVITSYV